MNSLLVVIALCAGPDASTLSGQPSWFPLGGDVHHEKDRFEAERGLLAFRSQPSWYPGFPKSATKAEFDAWLQKQEGKFDIQTPQDGQYQIPTSPPFPKRLEDVALKSQGATLKFEIKPSTVAGELLFVLQLTADERAVQRETEHRRTNVIPFLFAFFAEGKGIAVEQQPVSQDSGSHHLVELVPAKSSKTWDLRVAAKSLDSIIPQDASECAIAASFSERQHEAAYDLPMFRGEVWDLKQIPPQILIRSNPVSLRRAADGWKVKTASDR